MRKTILALAFAMLTAAPALAAPCGPIPALPDTERRTEYTGVSSSTGPFSVGFQLYGDSTDYGNWLEVWVNGVKKTAVGDYTVTSPSGALGTLCLPISNAQVTFTTAQSGTIEIVGARRPRRASQLSENAGVTAHAFNQLNSDIIAGDRERWDLKARTLLAPPGDTLTVLPSAAMRASTILGFDASGNPSLISPTIGTGTVIGPATSVDGHVAVFDGVTGAKIKDGGALSITTANPTGQVGCTPVNGAAATIMRSDAAPALNLAASCTFTGNPTFAPSSGNALTINTPTLTTSKAINITQRGPNASTQAGPFYYNQAVITNEYGVTGAPGTDNLYGWLFEMDQGTANSQGNFSTATFVNFHTVNSAPSPARDTVALTAQCLSQASEGGTNTGAGAAGDCFAGSFVTLLSSGATNYFSISGAEVDVGGNAGSTFRHRLGWSVVGTGVVAAAGIDTAFEVSAAGQQFTTGLIFTDLHGSFGVATTGTLIGTNTSATRTVANGIDLSALTISGNLLAGPNGLTIDGSANIVAASVRAPLITGGTGTSGTQSTFKTTTGNGTNDQFEWKGGNNGGTSFGTWSTTSFTVNSSIAVNGTAGAGYLVLGTQSSPPAAPGGSNTRVFNDASGRLSWIKSDGFVRTFTSAPTADRIYTLPNVSDTLAVLGTAQTFTSAQTFSSNIIGALHAGGIAANSTLTLESTTGAGTTDSIIFKTGSQLTRMTIASNGAIGMINETNPQVNGTVISLNSTTGITASTASSTTILHLIGGDGNNGFFEFSTFGVGPTAGIVGTNASNTAASPGDSNGGVNLLSFQGRSRANGSYSGSSVVISLQTVNAQTSSDHSSQIIFQTTPTSSTTLTTAMTIQASGGVSVGTGTDPGIGAILANTSIKATTYNQTGTTTVGALPACGAGTKAARYFVTDSNAAFTAGIGAIVAAGGANNVPVTCDGTNWRIGANDNFPTRSIAA